MKKPSKKPKAGKIVPRARKGGGRTFNIQSLDDLTGDPLNPRKITRAEMEGLKNSLSEFGDLSGITFNVRTGQLVSGHQRREGIRQKFGNLEIQVDEGGRLFFQIPPTKEKPGGERFYIRMVDWSAKTQRAANIAANSAALSGNFTDALQDQLIEIQDEDMELFQALRFNELIDSVDAGSEKEAEVPFSEELDEASNYIVLKIETGTDWAQVQTVLNLKSVNAKRRNGKPWSKGVGRVIPWAEAVKAIQANHHE